jgi:hypothetical protein
MDDRSNVFQPEALPDPQVCGKTSILVARRFLRCDNPDWDE